MLEKARRAGLNRVRGAGGIAVIPPDWRARLRERPEREPRARLGGVAELRRVGNPKKLLRQRPNFRAMWARPSQDQMVALLRDYRILLAGLAVVVVFAASDTTFTGLTSDRALGPDQTQRIAVPYPLVVDSTPPSARRYLTAIANGEQLREKAVVAAAARATLERAKVEAAAAAAGRKQPWITAGSAAPPTPIPGSIVPGIGGLVGPARGVFTSGFGSRWGTFHNGIDIAGPIGTPIYAVANGTVIDAGPAQGFGLWVRIRHDDGSITVYGHMYDFFVSVGERVPAGMQIARMGNRGDSTGPHLHFEVIVDGRHVDPQRWLARHGVTVD